MMCICVTRMGGTCTQLLGVFLVLSLSFNNDGIFVLAAIRAYATSQKNGW